MASIVYYSQCFFEVSCVLIDLLRKLIEALFSGCNVEVCFNSDVFLIEAVLLDETAKIIDILYDLR